VFVVNSKTKATFSPLWSVLIMLKKKPRPPHKSPTHSIRFFPTTPQRNAAKNRNEEQKSTMGETQRLFTMLLLVFYVL
jgi:hypothetical protein